MTIKIVPLGAGQDVGRSCIIVELGGRTIMLDCGIHMVDQQRFPDFMYLHGNQNEPQDFTKLIDLVIVSHFHLDHCGALPYFTENIGYDGPIIATPPTKAIIPLMLEDFRKVSQYQRGPDSNAFNQEMIKKCINKIQTIQLHETQIVKGDIKVTAYYAGHVLGAAMFHIECNGQSVTYTGDFNMSADRHLGSAWISKLRPDVVITETTYATTIRDSKRSREREFLKTVHETLDNGGKVLIPVFALGRAQELCILLETYWNRTGLKYPIYFSGGLTEKANFYYRLFINWTNEKIKKTFIQKNMFDFSHVRQFDQSSLKQETPMVFFATPGMLHGGLSLNTFKEWSGNPKNAVIIPGYCMPGTVGNKILSGDKKILIDDKHVDVKIQVYNMSFSAHADSKGIMELLAHLEPKNVVLVHGEKQKMIQLKQKVEETLHVPCFYPANKSVTRITTQPKIDIMLNSQIINQMNTKYHENILLYYRANSQVYLPNCLVANGIPSNKQSSFEILSGQEQCQLTEFDFDLEWVSPQYESEIYQSAKDSLIGKLVDSVVAKKMLAMQAESLFFKDQEIQRATVIAQNLMSNCIEFDDQSNEIVVKFQAGLNEDLGEWLIDIINQNYS